MVTVFDCMPNHSDCTLTHNKLRRLYYINKNITETVYNKYEKNIGGGKSMMPSWQGGWVDSYNNVF